MSLLTVRLSAKDEKAVKALRADGVPIADLVRGTIQREYEARKGRPRSPRQIEELITAINAAHPIPPGYKRPSVDTTDRKAMHKFIVAKLTKKARG